MIAFVGDQFGNRRVAAGLNEGGLRKDRRFRAGLRIATIGVGDMGRDDGFGFQIHRMFGFVSQVCRCVRPSFILVMRLSGSLGLSQCWLDTFLSVR